MKAKPILKKVVKTELDVTFVEEAKIKKIELYQNSPFKRRNNFFKNERNFGGASYKIKKYINDNVLSWQMWKKIIPKRYFLMYLMI